MKLFSLIKNIKCRVIGNINLEISGLYHRDSEVNPGGLFFCLQGTTTNGELYARNAIENGAVAIVTQNELKNANIVQIIVKNARLAMSLIASNFYGNPSKKLSVVGVTGTNGKTTTTHILSDVFSKCGFSTAVVGTNGISYAGKKIDTQMTTPDPIELHKHFCDMVKKHVQYVFMEVSAHALDLYKVDGIMFDYMIFTNLTEDHLDYFISMDAYFNAKKKAFVSNKSKQALINVDDSYGKVLFDCIKMNKTTYSICDKADVFAVPQSINEGFQEFVIDGVKFKSPLIGKFNISNTLPAIYLLKELGFGLDKISELIYNLNPVAGRFNTITINGRLFVVDYAHTPDGLENVLKLCKSMNNNLKKLICVFGCGGNRETQKRKVMGEISTKIADFTVITSDNPRFEDRHLIAKQIEEGVINNNYKVVLDRREAIKFAYSISEHQDIILVAGKGAENYIDEQGIKTPYSDMEEIKKLRELNE